jgi:hypothetical protein
MFFINFNGCCFHSTPENAHPLVTFWIEYLKFVDMSKSINGVKRPKNVREAYIQQLSYGRGKIRVVRH